MATYSLRDYDGEIIAVSDNWAEISLLQSRILDNEDLYCCILTEHTVWETCWNNLRVFCSFWAGATHPATKWDQPVFYVTSTYGCIGRFNWHNAEYRPGESFWESQPF